LVGLVMSEEWLGLSQDRQADFLEMLKLPGGWLSALASPQTSVI
jgi:hypothetical protein